MLYYITFYTIIIIVFILSVIFLYIILPFIITLILRKRFRNQINKSKCICLTFDDGPNPDSTPQILGLLQAADVKATFFVKGKNVLKYPDITKNIVDLGHEIGDHSFSHKYAWYCDPYRTLTDIIRGKRAIEKFIRSSDPILLRPPFGKLNLASLLYVILARRRLAFWNVDPKDYQQESGKQVADFVIKHLSPGKVILLHDGRGNTTDNSMITVDAVKLILENSKKRGLKLITISKIFTE